MKSCNSYSDGTWSRQKHYAVKIEPFLSYLMHSGRLGSTLTSRLRGWEIGAENPYINSMPSCFVPLLPHPANSDTHAVRRPFVASPPPTLRTNTTSPSTLRPVPSPAKIFYQLVVHPRLHGNGEIRGLFISWRSAAEHLPAPPLPRSAAVVDSRRTEFCIVN